MLTSTTFKLFALTLAAGSTAAQDSECPGPKACPDGSFVVHTGPNCEAQPCDTQIDLDCPLDLTQSPVCANGFPAGIIGFGADCKYADCPEPIKLEEVVLCLEEPKTCWDGTVLRKTGPNCEYEEECPLFVPCLQEHKTCPDGTVLWKEGPNCDTYQRECPDVEGCADDRFRCPDGSEVGRVGDACDFGECPVLICPLDVKECPDGSFVYRKGDDCQFEECPYFEGCAPDKFKCPDGSEVGRVGDACDFGECPVLICPLDTKDCPDGSVVRLVGPDCEWEECKKKGGSYDDPHFRTWMGDYYDFMGACDLKLLHAPNFDTNMELDINIRTKVRYDYSFIESAVIKIGDETLEVGSFGSYFLNGVASAKLPAKISGYWITKELPKENVNMFQIQISEEESITIKTYKDMVSVEVEDAKRARFHDSEGMMGDFESGLLFGRDGVTAIVNDPNTLAREWQIRDTEPMLFQTVQGPQYPKKCVMPRKMSVMAGRQRRLGESVARTAAAKACAGWKENKEGCIHDVMATGDYDLAAAGEM